MCKFEENYIFEREYRTVDNTLLRWIKEKKEEDKIRGIKKFLKRKLSGAPEGKIWFIFSILTMVYIDLEGVCAA